MAEETKNEIEKTETVAAAPAESSEVKEEAKKNKENKLEILVAIFLGVTALLTAWATWIGSLHGGNQSTNYTKSNNTASDGNSLYNEGLQLYLSDLMAWNTYMEYSYDLAIAQAKGDEIETQLIEEKLEVFADQNFSPDLIEAYNKMTDDMNSPFTEEFVDSYFTEAEDKLAESRALLEEGQKDNANGDSYNLVNVIYSIVLFMLGIIGIFKRLPNRTVVFGIAVFFLVLATIYMFTIPMPTGFSFSSFFSH